MNKVRKYILFWLIFLLAILNSVFLFAQDKAPALELLSPKRGEEIPYGGDVVIAISIYDLEGDTDTTSAELKVDNVDVTAQASVSAMLITYPFKETSDPGKHTFSLIIKDRKGNSSELVSYFNISSKPRKERRYTANGSIRAGVEYDREASESVIGVMNLYVYGAAMEAVDYALSVDLTNEKSTDEQRLSSYRLDLSFPFGNMVLGDTTPVFSSYMIDGTEVFGVHFQPRFGPLGFDLLYGRSYKAVEDYPDTEIFKQMVYGWRFEAGSARRFLWALSFLKVKDDKDSISEVDETPKDNIVLGTDFTLTLAKGKIELGVEANESLYNEDITDGAQDFEELPSGIKSENWEWLFTINEHMVPFVPGFANLATKMTLEIGPYYDNTFNAEASYVGPSYFSLGNETLTNDKAGLRVWDSLWLLQRKLFISGAYQYYRDNVRNTLEETTNTHGVSASTYVYLNDFLSFNAGVDILNTSDDVEVDTLNTTINAGVTQDIDIFTTSSSAYFNGTAILVKDEIYSSNESNDFTTRLGLISYFNNIPLDTKAVLGFDFGDSPNSIYLQGRGGYWFFPEETLYAYLDVIYETGPEEFDLSFGSTFTTIYDITLEGNAEYFYSPSFSDVILSLYATKDF